MTDSIAKKVCHINSLTVPNYDNILEYKYILQGGSSKIKFDSGFVQASFLNRGSIHCVSVTRTPLYGPVFYLGQTMCWNCLSWNASIVMWFLCFTMHSLVRAKTHCIMQNIVLQGVWLIRGKGTQTTTKSAMNLRKLPMNICLNQFEFKYFISFQWKDSFYSRLDQTQHMFSY